MPDPAERIAQVLAEHREGLWSINGVRVNCICGWRMPIDSEDPALRSRAHVAEEILAALGLDGES